MSRVDEVTAEIHGFSEPGAEPVPWATALEQVRAADTFWISTVRPDGRPHVTPLVAVWHDDALWFTTGPGERKARNLAHHAPVALTTGRSDLAGDGLDVVIEGRAEVVGDAEELRAVAAAFAAKYGTATWHFVVRDGVFVHADVDGPVLVFRVRPVRGLGFRKGDHPSQTTWTFPR
ncbi:pyridoxamine 5'-phosphate oxidase family protein [Isoptericola sp. NPDC019693]|uniref:pyridoxamine 5'-phosphate oxidase family protein n=1 Tax=Isoptericola sp. NPDC019693 TaxID=3364009 RepID=UPI0037B3BD1F